MSHPAAETSLPFSLDLVFRRGLGRTLLVYLIAGVYIPITGMAVCGYYWFRHHLEQDLKHAVALTADLQGLKVQHLLDANTTDPLTDGQRMNRIDLVKALDRMLTKPPNGAAGYRFYLVDRGLNLVAGTDGRLTAGNTVGETALTRWWQEARTGSGDASAPRIYTGPDGRDWMGTYQTIRFHSQEYALIAEVDIRSACRTVDLIRDLIVGAMVVAGLGMLMVSAAMARKIVVPIDEMGTNIELAEQGRFDRVITVPAGREIGKLVTGLNRIIHRLKTVQTENDIQVQIMSGLNQLHQLIGGEQDVRRLSVNTLEFLCGFLDLTRANAFIVGKRKDLICTGRWPGRQADDLARAEHLAGGRVDHTALDPTITAFRMPPVGDVTPVTSIKQANLMVVPIGLKHMILGFLELETSDNFCRFDERFLGTASELIAVILNAALVRQQESSLQKQTQAQAKQLAKREAALEASTRELQFQRQVVRESQKKLKRKEFELEAANAQMYKNAADLEAHMEILEKQKVDMQKQNAALEKAHRELAEKARQLESSSRYKTEFMANMSHELRTPLNSTLLLSRLLLENKENTLTPKQQEFAKTIHSAGEDLLTLINEILDLAKVESGKMEVDLAPVDVRTMANAMRVGFAPLAEQKGVTFVIHVAPDVPDQMFTDRKRIEQIVKNFLSNAFKFTTEGTIRLEFAVTHDRVVCRGAGSGSDNGCLSISVVDTGIGIPRSKHEMVFEAFQQVDGSTRRKYGGTGLGLSISRELAHLLGGEISLESDDGRGSRFTLHLPIFPLPDQEPAMIRHKRPRPVVQRNPTSPVPARPEDEPATANQVPDDRNRLAPGDLSILIISDDKDISETIKDHAYDHGYKVLIAEQFQTGLHFADHYLPTAVFTHSHPSDSNGWRIIRQLKDNPNSRHIPVFTLSPDDEAPTAAIHGAAGHVREPIDPHRLTVAFRTLERLRTSTDRRVLAVGWDNAAPFTSALGSSPIRVETAATPEAAEKKWSGGGFDAMILSTAMDTAQQQRLIGRMAPGLQTALRYGDAPHSTPPSNADMPTDGPVLQHCRTSDQLLLALLGMLHLTPEAMDDERHGRLTQLDGKSSVFKDRKVLLVDDDMRTVFAVTSVLEDQGVTVITGKTGKESLDKLDGIPEIDLILMDVMIAEVDGYQAIRTIRERNRFKTLPIIALTAKAMQGDRAKCIEAGADDYLAKPVDLGKLTSMLKIWLDPKLAAPISKPS